MALTPKGDWEAGDEYPAARLNDLEAAAAAGESAAALLASKADKTELNAKADQTALDAAVARIDALENK